MIWVPIPSAQSHAPLNNTPIQKRARRLQKMEHFKPIRWAGNVTWHAGSRHVTSRKIAHWSSIVETFIVIGQCHTHITYTRCIILSKKFQFHRDYSYSGKVNRVIGFTRKQHRNNASCLKEIPVSTESRWCLYLYNVGKSTINFLGGLLSAADFVRGAN